MESYLFFVLDSSVQHFILVKCEVDTYIVTKFMYNKSCISFDDVLMLCDFHDLDSHDLHAGLQSWLEKYPTPDCFRPAGPELELGLVALPLTIIIH